MLLYYSGQVGRSWLSSSGDVRAKTPAEVEITFDSFWAGGAPGGGGGPRADPVKRPSADDRRPLDALINAVGKQVRRQGLPSTTGPRSQNRLQNRGKSREIHVLW